MERILTAVFRDKRLSALWLVVRVWLGYQWLSAGLHKAGDPLWVGAQAGTAIKGFWMQAAGLAAGPDGALLPAGAKYAWYQGFMEFLINTHSEVWFSYVIVAAEILVGIALIFGAFTVLAALGGALMNLNFMLAGSASTNPVLYTLAILLIIAGVNAGYYGLDRFLAQWLGRRRRLAGTGDLTQTG